MNYSPVIKPAPLKNIAAFSTMMTKVVDRRADLPGIGCFYGPSGFGKSKAAVYGANRYQAGYVECGQFTSARSLLISILQELGVDRPRGTITDMISEAVMIMAGNVRRPIIIDEAHHVAHKRFIDVVRELHDKSGAPVILIGEETLPKQLEAYERVHNRILTWVPALPCDAEDFSALARHSVPNLTIADDLAQAILKETRGNTRRIVVNLAEAAERARALGKETIDLAEFGGPGAIVGSKAPLPRGF